MKMFKKHIIVCLFIICAVNLSAPVFYIKQAFAGENIEYNEEDDEYSDASDPAESFNRLMFTFNDRLYFWMLKPVAQGYQYITPDFVRTGVKNFFRNLGTPLRFASCILQGKRKPAENEFARFLVNSTFGLGGLFDITSHIKEMNPPEEDLGQALGHYGAGEGIYIVWPFLGSSNLRDSTGYLAGIPLDPKTYIAADVSIGMSGLNAVNTISSHIGDYETIKEAAFDPYIMVRDAYTQRRNAEIRK